MDIFLESYSLPAALESGSPMMNNNPDTTPSPINPRSARLAALAILALCALVAFGQGIEGGPRADPISTAWAVGLGLTSIVLRRRAQDAEKAERTTDILGCAAMAAAAGLGLLGAWEALRHGAGQTGLLFVTAGVLFSIRPLQRPAKS